MERYMSNSTENQQINIHLAEYQKLKDEQIARIGFRDNLIYATLIAVGGILSYALSNPTNSRAVLVLPLATVALGWTYLINDEKISALGRYVRNNLAQRVGGSISVATEEIFGWERITSGDKGRLWRKIVQFVVNEALFVGSGFVALSTYLTTERNIPGLFWIVTLVEMVFLGVLAFAIAVYAEFTKDNDAESSAPASHTQRGVDAAGDAARDGADEAGGEAAGGGRAA
jgi:hypothetical protein